MIGGVKLLAGQWYDISMADHVREPFAAILKMKSGMIYEAIWTYNGRCCAWWPIDSRRRFPIAKYEPLEFMPIREAHEHFFLPRPKREKEVA